MADLKDFNFQHWWTLMAAAGAAIAVASISVQYTPSFLIGLGLLFFGVGEWVNRPRQPYKQTVEGMLGFRMVSANPWKPNVFGLILDAIGFGLFGLGLFRVAFGP